MSILGPVMFTASRYPRLVFPVAFMGAVSSACSMGAGEHMSEETSEPGAPVAMGLATFAGSVLPAVPYLWTSGIAAVCCSAVICVAVAAGVGHLRSWRKHRYAETVAILGFVAAVTVGCNLLLPGGARMKAMHGGHLWREHPGVRSGDQLSAGERAADRLKAAFGSWAFLIVLNSFIVAWCVLNGLRIVHFDVYPFIALNLILSWLAAQQGGALQIAANRGDRISSEVALHTQANTDALMEINRQQLAILSELREIREHLGDAGQ
jgi:Protein of unknown function (DUF1003)